MTRSIRVGDRVRRTDAPPTAKTGVVQQVYRANADYRRRALVMFDTTNKVSRTVAVDLLEVVEP